LAAKFLENYIPRWDGFSNSGPILDLLSYLPPQDFLGTCFSASSTHPAHITKGIQERVISPLENAILNGAHAPFDTLFDFYGKLVSRWIITIPTQLLTGQVDIIKKGFKDLLSHASVLALSALATSESSMSAVLGYYEHIASATSTTIAKGAGWDLLLIVPPSPSFYTMSMTSSLASFSRLCGLLVTYRSILETKRRVLGINDKSTSMLNSHIMDMCNLLWRSRAFVKNENNSLGCLCADETSVSLRLYLPRLDRDYSLASMFGVSWNPLLAPASNMVFRELEQSAAKQDAPTVWHAGPVSQRSLVATYNEGGVEISWRDYRIAVLDFLDTKGVKGIRALIYATMKDMK
jgi:centromere protein I